MEDRRPRGRNERIGALPGAAVLRTLDRGKEGGSTSAYPLEARLKYRESGGKLSFWYELIRPDRVFKTAVVDDLQKIKDATGFPIVFGTP